LHLNIHAIIPISPPPPRGHPLPQNFFKIHLSHANAHHHACQHCPSSFIIPHGSPLFLVVSSSFLTINLLSLIILHHPPWFPIVSSC
jgi:hypothetical protein